MKTVFLMLMWQLCILCKVYSTKNYGLGTLSSGPVAFQHCCKRLGAPQRPSAQATLLSTLPQAGRLTSVVVLSMILVAVPPVPQRMEVTHHASSPSGFLHFHFLSGNPAVRELLISIQRGGGEDRDWENVPKSVVLKWGIIVFSSWDIFACHNGGIAAIV